MFFTPQPIDSHFLLIFLLDSFPWKFLSISLSLVSAASYFFRLGYLVQKSLFFSRIEQRRKGRMILMTMTIDIYGPMGQPCLCMTVLHGGKWLPTPHTVSKEIL